VLISNAYAQTAGAAAGPDMIMQIVLFGGMFAVMWFLMIRPQLKKAKEHKAMVDALRRGDMVLTQAGIIGKIVHLREDGEVEVEIAKDMKVRMIRSAVVQVLSKTEPAANN